MWWRDAQQLCEAWLACAGLVPTLFVGPDAVRGTSADAADWLLRRGVDVRRLAGRSPADGHAWAGALAQVDARRRGVLLTNWLDGAPREAHRAVAGALLAAGVGPVLCAVELPEGLDRPEVERAWLEAGWRRHPRLMRAVPFAELEVEGRHALLLFEPVGSELVERYPLAWLAEHRGLHMDMLREAGRRSDAHLARYTLACDWIRRGDRVLDMACGLGYGAHVLRAGSPAAEVLGVDASERAIEYARAHFAGKALRFEQGDAGALAMLPDESVDTVVCMETLEHVPEPRRVLAELARVLSPGGRLVVSVPNRWGDTRGPFPNPHHLHEYTWDELREQLEAHFLPERRWRQTAGGGRCLRDQPRVIEPVAWDASHPTSADEPPAEWWLACAMKSPVGATKRGYRETLFPTAPEGPDAHVAAFARDYDNPWLVRAMVGVGDRLTDRVGLERLAGEVARTARPGSPDQGAAVCVLAYAALGREVEADWRGALPAIDAFDAAADASEHALRWRVSNQFVAGLLCLRLGERARAQDRFERCAGHDVLAFSPLLATKTVEACLLCGVLCQSDGAHAAAREWWMRGVREARRVVQGDWLNVVGNVERPLSFGLRELGEVMDAASRCVGWLCAQPMADVRPGFAFASASALSIAEQRAWTQRLQHAKEWLDGQRHALAAELERSVTHARALEAELGRRGQSVSDEVAGLSDRLEREIAYGRAMTEALTLHQEQLRSQGEALAWHQAQLREQQQAAEWQRQQAGNWQAIAAQREATIEELKGWTATLDQAKAWHEARATDLQHRLDAHAQQLGDVQRRSDEQARLLGDALASIEGLERRLMAKDGRIDELEREVVRLSTLRGVMGSVRALLLGRGGRPSVLMPGSGPSAGRSRGE